EGEIYTDLVLPPPGWRNSLRPYVIINMVSSVDGSTSIEGKASPLGSSTDRQTMRNLRSKADAVMVGAGTLRAEKLSLGLDDPPGGRQPLAVIATNSGDLPLEDNLVIDETQELLILTTHATIVQLPGDKTRLRATPADESGNLDLLKPLQTLKQDHGVDVLLVEGGPKMNHYLVSKELADELFLTLAPKLVGDSPTHTILEGPPLSPRAQPPELLSVHQASDELFLRYRLSTNA
ncbi:MAG: RibD family protein, partial [Rubrobacter sp.]